VCGVREGTRENESDHVGEKLSANIKENEQKVNEPQYKRKKHLGHSRSSLKFNDRRVFRQLSMANQHPSSLSRERSLGGGEGGVGTSLSSSVMYFCKRS
jgi:hypothetical protein